MSAYVVDAFYTNDYRSGVIWQIDKGKRIWKNVSNSLNLLLEEAYQSKSVDVKQKNLSVSFTSPK